MRNSLWTRFWCSVTGMVCFSVVAAFLSAVFMFCVAVVWGVFAMLVVGAPKPTWDAMFVPWIIATGFGAVIGAISGWMGS